MDIKKFLSDEEFTVIEGIVKKIKELRKSDDTTEQILAAAIIALQSRNKATTLITPQLEQIYESSTKVANINTTLDTPSESVFQSYAKEYAQSRTADLVDGLDDSTRAMLKSDLMKYMDQGLSVTDIAKNLQSNYAFSEQRALTISRTETGMVWNKAAIDTYRLGGAKGVSVMDGDSDPECAEANGENWSFDYAEDHLLQHPNCVRSFGIMSDNDTLDRG